MSASGSIARTVLTAGRVIAGVLVIGIVLVLLEANEDNTVVDAVLEVGRFFADPFRAIFELDDPDVQIAVNWGIAAVVYLAAASLVAALLVRAAARPRRRKSG